MEDNNFKSHFFYLKNFKDSKLILIQRDFGDVVASMINRNKNNRIVHTDHFDTMNTYNYLINKKLLCFKNEENKKISKLLKVRFPNRVYICNFDNLILNTENEMRKISKFLKITYNKSLLQSTHFGKLTIRTDKKKIIGKKIFTKEKYLNGTQIKTLNLVEGKYGVENLKIIPIISFILLKTRYLLYRSIIKFRNYFI